MLSLLLDRRPRGVGFHFGLPGPTILAALRDSRAILLASATSLREAREIMERGLDAVIAQGWGAGGHRGILDPDSDGFRLSTEDLTKQFTRSIDLPVIAAGGIMDGADVSGALGWGAVAAQMGTAFLASRECGADGFF